MCPANGEAGATPNEARPRVIMTTDGEVDDRSSFVRFLMYVSDFDVVGIVATNSKWQKNGHGTDWMLKAIERYEQVLPNLRKHDERYPEAEFLRSRVMLGNEDPKYLFEPPPHQDTPGSELIIRTLLDDDPRPVFIPAWGGANTTAHALWKLKRQHSAEEYRRAASRARIYCISFQDGAGRWIVENIPEAMIVEAGSWYKTWNYHPQEFQPHKEYMSAAWLRENVKEGHGPLGAWYPQGVVSEGDTPSFLELVDNGLRSWQDYGWGGWGGRFQRVEGSYWRDAEDQGDDRKPLTRWTPATQNDFEAQMDWCVTSEEHANHPPAVVLAHPEDLTASPGESVTLDAGETTDPDGDELTFRWWRYADADSHDGPVEIRHAEQPVASLALPSDIRSGATVHMICEVVDDGSPPLTAYRRVVVTADAAR